MFSVSYPRGDIFRKVGSDDSVELFCHLNPSHSFYKKVGGTNFLFQKFIPGIFCIKMLTIERNTKRLQT